MVKHHVRRRHSLQTAGRDQKPDNLVGLIAVTLVLLAVTAWSYWPTITTLFKEWQSNDDYSAGQLVPLVALVLLWVDRKRLKACSLKPCWWGMGLLVIAYAGRTYGQLFMFESGERYSLVLTIAGLVLVVAGWQVFWRVKWILLFLFLMVPFPGRVHNLISGPLQNLATTGGVFLLEAIIGGVSRHGNVVMLDENTPIAVAEACSGLRMLTAFIIVAGFIAYVVKRARWRKAVLLLSSIPVAVACNILRIFVTAVLMLHVSTEAGEKFFHDFAGLVMMPAAVILIFGELSLMDKLVEPDSGPKQGPVITRAKQPKPAARVTSSNTLFCSDNAE